MKQPLTNISVTKHARPPAGAMAAVDDTDVSKGNGSNAGAATTVNVTGAITYTGSSSVTVTGDVDVIGMVESVFLTRFRETFVGTGGPSPWPPDNTNTPAERSTAFTDVFRSMFMLLEQGTEPPGGDTGSAKQMVRDLIEDTLWPTDNPKAAVPEPWNSNGQFKAFRRYEITCAIYLMMRALNGVGAAGGSTPFPPDH